MRPRDQRIAVARRPLLRLAVVSMLFGATADRIARSEDFEREPINYSATIPQNVVSRLKTDFDFGRVHFDYDERWGYLRSLLRALRVPESSQKLVFSKTSFQRQRIAPKSPRALYFNDEVYVGYCSDGDVIEISAVDPKLGAVFYTLDQEQLDRPRIVRQADSCLLCHANSQTSAVPGFVLRSVYVDAKGYPVLGSSAFETDQTSPLKNRWGGWYVTGLVGKQKHLGNLISGANQSPEEVDNSAGLNVTSLTGRFDSSKYLAATSDLVALMVMEHQTRAHNLITAANFETRIARAQSALSKAPAGSAKQPTGAHSRIEAAGEQLVKYLLFSGEATLTEPVRGTTDFARQFASRGPRDKRGRSLRDFDLEHRLFKYPCSYLIYSAAFDGLPREVKEYVARRLGEVLRGTDQSREFAHLSVSDRLAIREILQETKPDLAAAWKPPAPVAAR
jgi:hypothetical protein